MNCQECRTHLPDIRPETPETPETPEHAATHSSYDTPDQHTVPEACLKHLETCDACRSWLDAQVATAPAGLSPAYFDQPPAALAARVIPARPATATDSGLDESTAGGLSWLENLKRALVAAMALGAGAYLWLGVPQIDPETQSPQVFEVRLPAQHPGHTEFSFLTEEVKLSDIQFVDSSERVIPDERTVLTQHWSFLEAEDSYQFIDETQEEDT
jgi:hypothetical protein